MQHEFTLLGDALWLDFINTARGRSSNPPDLLPDDAAVLRWATSQQLDVNGGAPPVVLLHGFRDRLSALAEALNAGLQPPAGSIAAINQHLAQGEGCHQLTRVSGEWRLRFTPERRPSLLEAIAQSAAASLSDTLRLVRRCAAPTCSLFFIDDSPNQSRLWCSAAVCGCQSQVERRRGLLR
ncbi:MAG TPA: CGNR zinc finger domain-containing protein [Gemmatimonadales bacterium]|jgi:predicted RNA-binding Zn ribbon-like protein|nr:CGNR zinc finger domain-containing protein [Gemmatimonadales bacterium]